MPDEQITQQSADLGVNKALQLVLSLATTIGSLILEKLTRLQCDGSCGCLLNLSRPSIVSRCAPSFTGWLATRAAAGCITATSGAKQPEFCA